MRRGHSGQGQAISRSREKRAVVCVSLATATATAAVRCGLGLRMAVQTPFLYSSTKGNVNDDDETYDFKTVGSTVQDGERGVEEALERRAPY